MGNGNQKFYNWDEIDFQPFEVIINGINDKEDFSSNHNLEREENNIILKWDNSLTKCSYMFYHLSNIIKIDLSNFDLSQVKTMASMFEGCESLISVNINNSNSNSVTDMNYMFYGCTSLKSINFGNFDTISVEDMNSLFCDCSSLETLDLNNFKTSSVKNFISMFSGCSLLTSLDLNHFDTSSTTDMNEMFRDCKLLEILKISNFETSLVEDMRLMFYECNSLKILNLSHFNTESVTYMNHMFYECNSLLSLDISNFNTELVDDMRFMFYGCNSLLSLNIYNFYTTDFTNMECMFEGINSDIILCINEMTSSTIFMDRLTDAVSINNNNCTHICFLNDIKLLVEKNQCIDNCFHDDIYKFEYNNICYEKCPNGTFSVNNNSCIKGYHFEFGTSTLEYQTSTSFPTEINFSIPLDNFEISTYIKNNDYTSSAFIDYDKNTNFPSIHIEFSNNNDFSSTYIENEEKNDFSSTDKNTYFSNNSKYYDNNSFSIISSYEHFDLKDSISYNINQENKDNYSLNECIINNNTEINKIKTEIIRNIKKDSTICKINLFKIFEKEQKDMFIKENNIIYQISSTYNQKNNIYNNISSIILGECEERLKQRYKIDDNETIIIFKMDIFGEKSLIPIIEYEIYNLETEEKKLDLNICKDLKIKINIPVFIDENYLFKYNSSSEYYNDKCFPYTTDKKTDIILEDRRKEYINNNMSLCEKECKYNYYDVKTKKVECECLIKIKFPLIDEIVINKDKFLNTFKNIKSSLNIIVIKCYKLLFSKKGIKYNIGNYIIISIIELILLILFKFKGYKEIINKINEIIKIKLEEKNNSIIYIPKDLSGSKKKIKIKKKLKKNKIHKSKSGEKENKNKDEKEENDIKIYNKNKINKNSKISEQKSLNQLFNSRNTIKSNTLLINNIINIGKNNINNDNINYNDYELNTLTYEKAVLIDKRTYIQYYFSLIKITHLIIFTFYTKTDYNSKIIKISLFLFSFTLYYVVNALFFNDSTMHKIYEDEGSFNFIYQLPQIIFSTIISAIINAIVKFLSLSEKKILSIKDEQNNVKLKASKVLKCLTIKIILFFILIFSFLLFFWYFLSCFCAVYINTQISLINDTIISFGLSLLYPFIINLLPGISRLYALYTQNKDKKCIYNFSKFIQPI